MSQRTHQFTRDALLECARRELAMRESVYPRRVAERKMTQPAADHETDAMAAIVAVLEAYPLQSVARSATRVIEADLRERKGFRALIESLPANDWRDIIDHWVRLLERSVHYTTPVAPPETAELDFDAPAAPPAAEPPAADGGELDFA